MSRAFLFAIAALCGSFCFAGPTPVFSPVESCEWIASADKVVMPKVVKVGKCAIDEGKGMSGDPDVRIMCVGRVKCQRSDSGLIAEYSVACPSTMDALTLDSVAPSGACDDALTCFESVQATVSMAHHSFGRAGQSNKQNLPVEDGASKADQ